MPLHDQVLKKKRGVNAITGLINNTSLMRIQIIRGWSVVFGLKHDIIMNCLRNQTITTTFHQHKLDFNFFNGFKQPNIKV